MKQSRKSVNTEGRLSSTHLGMAVSVLGAALRVARTPALVVDLLLEGPEGGGGAGPGPCPRAETSALAHINQSGEALGHKQQPLK